MAASVVFAVINGKLDEFTKSMFDASKSAVELSLYLLGIVSLWMGLTKIIEDSGLIHKFSKAFRPLISRLFKNIPEDHPSITMITLNMMANMLGLGNAATPLGLKAIEELQSLNPDKEVISFEMMLFIVINTSSLQIIPFTIIGLLAQYGAKNPAIVVLPTLIASFVTTACAVCILYIFRKFSK